MKAALISVTEQGRALSKTIGALLISQYQPQRFCYAKHTDEFAEPFDSVYALAERLFPEYQALVFVCSCGIAVRAIAPLVRSKEYDPAVLVVDDGGSFVIPILSGHIGGANRLAELLAQALGAIPVITTATDVGKKFSPDSFAVANHLLIEDMTAAKLVAAAILDGEKIGLQSDYPYRNLPRELSENLSCPLGICISADSQAAPFGQTLRLIPQNIVVGIGCKKGAPRAAIQAQVQSAFAQAGISTRRICAVATIDRKAQEPGLLEYCAFLDVPLRSYSAAELMAVEGSFTPSAFVQSQVGVDNVCERSAVKCSGGPLLFRKFPGGGVTVAAAEKPIILDFEKRMLSCCML